MKPVKTEQELKTEHVAHLLSTFAYHIRTIATNKPGNFGLGLSHGDVAVHVQVEIKERTDPDKFESIWDQVFIDGQSCGNRPGGCDTYAKLVAPVLLAASK